MVSVDRILKLFEQRGDSDYGGEDVTQLEHALQCATLAESERASSALITAALLHDIGHLLHALPSNAPDDGIDDLHEELGCRYLERIFGAAVTEPVRLHVPAKRYLCATDADYFHQLSAPSIQSLQMQGGPMTPQDVAEFEAGQFADDAVRLRRWDDAGKIPKRMTPSLAHFRAHLLACAMT